MNFLDLSDAMAVAQEHLGHRPFVRDDRVLESAIMRPQWIYSYNPDADIDMLAAELLYGLCRQQGLVDGNKRTAWVNTVYFYQVNGLDLIVEREQQEPAVF